MSMKMKVSRKELQKELKNARKRVSKMLREEKDALFCKGMRIIYGEKI